LITNWSKELGIDRTTIYTRLESGWSVDEALGTPIRKRIVIEYNDVSKTIYEWADELGIPAGTLDIRIRRGWSVARAFTK